MATTKRKSGSTYPMTKEQERYLMYIENQLLNKPNVKDQLQISDIEYRNIMNTIQSILSWRYYDDFNKNFLNTELRRIYIELKSPLAYIKPNVVSMTIDMSQCDWTDHINTFDYDSNPCSEIFLKDEQEK